MERTILKGFLLVELGLVSAFMLLYPRIARAGLLFGVYVGEERARSEAARAITRAWYRGMFAAIALAVALVLFIGSRPVSPFGVIAPALALGAAFAALYLRAYGRARQLAPHLGRRSRSRRSATLPSRASRCRGWSSWPVRSPASASSSTRLVTTTRSRTRCRRTSA